MIFDTILNAQQYAGIHPGIDQVLAEAKKYTAESFPKERLYLDSDALFMNFAEYDTHAKEGALTEAHRRYIDVMYMVEGCETIYVKSVNDLKNITTPYNAENDALLADTDDDVTAVRLTAGSFIVLFPQDAHAPGCYTDNSCHVKKIIGKVLLSE